MAVLATDDFNRADSPNLGANWSTTSFDTLQIVSQTAQKTVNGPHARRYTNVTAPDDQYAKITMGALGSTNGDGPGPTCRANSTDTFYLAQANTLVSRIYKCVASSFTQLGSDGAAASNGETLQLEVTGTSVTLRKNGTIVVGPVTDSAIASGDWGVWMFAGAADNPTIDDWEAGTPETGKTFLLNRV